jgi:hypothetical protein
MCVFVSDYIFEYRSSAHQWEYTPNLRRPHPRGRRPLPQLAHPLAQVVHLTIDVENIELSF